MKQAYQKPVLTRQGILTRVTAIPGSAIPSDRRLKTNISPAGTTVFGLPLYRFSYLGSSVQFKGVMAQDVLGVMPEAVTRDASGFYNVDYHLLGIEMTRA